MKKYLFIAIAFLFSLVTLTSCPGSEDTTPSTIEIRFFDGFMGFQAESEAIHGLAQDYVKILKAGEAERHREIVEVIQDGDSSAELKIDFSLASISQFRSGEMTINVQYDSQTTSYNATVTSLVYEGSSILTYNGILSAEIVDMDKTRIINYSTSNFKRAVGNDIITLDTYNYTLTYSGYNKEKGTAEKLSWNDYYAAGTMGYPFRVGLTESVVKDNQKGIFTSGQFRLIVEGINSPFTVAYSPNGVTLTTADGTVYIYK